MRSFAALLCLGLIAPTISAQPTPEPVDGVVVFKLTLSPAAAPQPVSKTYLLPEYRDELPGEKLSGFMKCFMEQQTFFNNENSLKREEWNKLPLDLLPKDMRTQAGLMGGMGYSPKYATMPVMLDQAARFNRLEWNDYTNFRHDGAFALLPEIQGLRMLAQVLAVRFRGEVSNGEFERAFVTAKTLFGLGKMLEQHPTMIGNLVGIAILQIGLNCVQEMMAQPGCPNLYWAFADLPTPLLSIRRGVEGERMFLTTQLNSLHDRERPLTPSELDKQMIYIEELINIEVEKTPFAKALSGPKVRYTMQAGDEPRMTAARVRLTEQAGIPAKTVRLYSPLQVAMADDLLQFEIYRDEITKWANIPYFQASGLKADDEKMKSLKSKLVLAPMLMASVAKVKVAETRLTQKVAYLRTLEALRLHAHKHGGILPKTLAEIELLLPNDPYTGKPFDYELKGDVAFLKGSDTFGAFSPTGKAYSVEYEIRMRK